MDHSYIKPTAVEGLIEWHRERADGFASAAEGWRKDRFSPRKAMMIEECDTGAAFHTEAIATLTRLEAEGVRLREALEGAKAEIKVLTEDLAQRDADNGQFGVGA